MTETIIVIGIVAVVLLLAGRSVYRTFAGKNAGCGCGGGCPSAGGCSHAVKGGSGQGGEEEMIARKAMNENILGSEEKKSL